MRTLLFLLMLSPMLLFAQNNKIKWGKIPPADLKMTVYESDTSATAVVLADIGSVSMDFERTGAVIKTDIHQRIKILKQAGFTYGDVEIPYYSGNNYESIQNMKAQVIHPDGTIIKVEKKDIFKIKTSDNFSSIKFSFPNLVEGCVIEYRYRREKKGLYTLPDWYFQREIPVRFSELKMEIPEFFTYVTLNQGRPLDIQKVSGGMTRISVNTRNGLQQIDVRMNSHHYLMENVPALKEESYVTTMNDYYARIRFQLKSVRFPGELEEPVMTSWSDLAEELMQSNSFGGRINRKGGVKQMVGALEPELVGVSDPKVKAAMIYDFVGKSIKWNEYYSTHAANDGDDCYRLGSGNSGEINLALLALLRAFEIEAYPILTSTRGHGKMVPLYPFEDQFNHVIVLVVLGEEQILADLPSAARPMGYLHVNSLNGQGWLVDKEIQQWLNLGAPMASEIVMLSCKMDEEGTISGDLSISQDGYFGVFHRASIMQEDENPWIEDFKETYPDAELGETEESGVVEIFEAYKMKTSTVLSEYAQGDDDFLYFSPFVFKFFEENPFSLAERSYPVEIAFPMKGKYILNVELPEGFEALELPAPTMVVLPNDGGSFSCRISQNGNRLQVISDYKINQLIYQPEEYELIKMYFDNLIEKQEEQIVLQKKT